MKRFPPHVSLWMGALLDLVFPRRCAACGGDVFRPNRHLCWDCLRTIRLVGDSFCSRCGDPVDGRVESDFVCSACRDRRPFFDVARSAVRYHGAIREAIHRFKYAYSTYLVDDLADFLVASVRIHGLDGKVDVVTGVPLYFVRRKERTYNQSDLLAKALARRIGKPSDSRLLARVRMTATQVGMSARERRRNVRGAFAVRAPDWVEGRRVLVVDDVMTTGATVDECARVLKRAGAAFVAVATVARGG